MQKKHALASLMNIMPLVLACAMSTSFTYQAQAKFTAPDGGCWCTTYVANRYHLPSSYPNAYQWPSWLQKLGWTRDRLPHVGDIEVLQPNVDGANKSDGHVGVIRTATHANNGQWSVTLQGAYQQRRHQFKDANCRNVSDWTSTLSIGSTSGVSYFYKVGVSRTNKGHRVNKVHKGHRR